MRHLQRRRSRELVKALCEIDYSYVEHEMALFSTTFERDLKQTDASLLHEEHRIAA